MEMKNERLQHVQVLEPHSHLQFLLIRSSCQAMPMAVFISVTVAGMNRVKSATYEALIRLII